MQDESHLLRAAEAAELLAISERHLWSLTKSGEIRCVRLGRAVRYDRADLLDSIDKLKEPRGTRPSREGRN